MAEVEILANGNVKMTIAMSFRNRAGQKRIVSDDCEQTFSDPLVVNLARAFRWQALIDSGQFSNAKELAESVGKDAAYVARVLRLTLLSPKIVHAALAGTLPNRFSVTMLKQAIPVSWSEQKQMFGIG